MRQRAYMRHKADPNRNITLQDTQDIKQNVNKHNFST